MTEYTLEHQRLEEAKIEMDAARNSYQHAEDDFRAAIRHAIAARMPAREVAAITGLSLARVYQIRDGVR